MSIKVSQLRFSRKWHAEREARKKWMKIWQDIGKRLLNLPEWMQNIVLEDINTAVKNRLVVMEMIHNAAKQA